MNFKTTLLAILIIYGFSDVMQAQDSIMQAKAEIELLNNTIINSIAWAKNKDIGLLYNIMADDSALIVVQPNPGIVKGIYEFKKGEKFWMHPDFKAIQVEIRDMHINISQSGTVAWWYCELDDINEWKGKPANWENARWTGVLEKRQGTWVIVQMHFSFAKE